MMKLKQAIDIVKYLSILKRIQEKTLKGVESFLRSCNFAKKISMKNFMDPVRMLSERPVQWTVSMDRAEKLWILRGGFYF